MRLHVQFAQPLQQFEAVARLRKFSTDRNRSVILHERRLPAIAQRLYHVLTKLWGSERCIASSSRRTAELEHVVVQRRQLVARARHGSGERCMRVRDRASVRIAVYREVKRYLARWHSTGEMRAIKINQAQLCEVEAVERCS